MKNIPRTVIVLGIVSLLMDMASEMLYPISPLYLTSILHASIVWLGLIEGLAEAISGLSKGYFGALSDTMGRRRPFVTLGYLIAAISKPLPWLSASVGGVFGARVLDRIGKGMRTAPRDALLAGYATDATRGAVFGFHRAMDTVGAAIGPIIAVVYLSFHPGDYGTLFVIAFAPALLAALATLFVKETAFKSTAAKPGIRDSLRFWRSAPSTYRSVIVWLTLFALVNSSDMFLIARARDLGFDPRLAIAAYIAYNLIFAVAAYPGGRLSDRVGRRTILVAGLLLYGVAYGCFALATGTVAVWVGFGLYGLFAALTDGVSKAWISDLVPNERRGLAIGLQTTLGSLGALAASVWTGVVWQGTGAKIPLLTAAVVAILVAIGLSIAGRRSGKIQSMEPASA